MSLLLSLALLPLGIHVVRESDEGIGSIDFRFLYTTPDGVAISVSVEFKLAHHKKLEHGITTQLPKYLQATNSKSGTFVVMWFKDGKIFKQPKNLGIEECRAWILEKAQETSNAKEINLTAYTIDASIRPSASKC